MAFKNNRLVFIVNTDRFSNFGSNGYYVCHWRFFFSDIKQLSIF
ncbi:hypothetical protein [Oenococcus oeni]|nr:hypothetical protein [Oenococcus oeni]